MVLFYWAHNVVGAEVLLPLFCAVRLSFLLLWQPGFYPSILLNSMSPRHVCIYIYIQVAVEIRIGNANEPVAVIEVCVVKPLRIHIHIILVPPLFFNGQRSYPLILPAPPSFFNGQLR